MNKLEAEIIILKDLLQNCEYTISFLHNCLVDENHIQYRYTYPYQTTELLQVLQKEIGTRNLCYHSSFNKDCSGCIDSLKYREKLQKAKEIIKNEHV